MYVSNPQNSSFDDLHFDCDQRSVPMRQMYLINYYIIETLKNGSIIDVYTNQI